MQGTDDHLQFPSEPILDGEDGNLPFDPDETRSVRQRTMSRRKRLKHFKPTQPPTVLVVDPDLGFVWWLGEILRNAGCAVVPALNCEHAITLMKELSVSLDVVFVDPTLTAVSSMIETLKVGQDRIQVVDVGSLTERF